MKRIIAIASAFLLVTPLLARAATNDLTALVRNGLFEEEANHNLDAAIQSYQTAIAGYDSDRQLAATAIFRLGECYRKLGRTNEANAQYAGILREFPDQSQLASLSGAHLPQDQIPASSGVADADMTPEERNELLKIQQMIHTSPDIINGNSGESELLGAIGNNWIHVIRLLLDSGASPNSRTSDGWMPICKASDVGNEQLIELLLDHGADVNGRNSSGKTALYYAARNGFLTIARTLLQHHADPTLENRESDDGWSGATPLIVAACRSDPRVAGLLITNGADVNAPDYNGVTPLTAAVSKQNIDTARLLIAHGAKIKPALIWAVAANDLPTALVLLTNGAEVNGVYSTGQTPLFYAVKNSHFDMAQLLLSHGATVNVFDEQKVTPLELCKTDDMRALLHKFGASDDFDRLGGIYVKQADNVNLGQLIFSEREDTKEYHSLFEVVACLYAIRWNPERIHLTGQPLPFPDLAHIMIDRVAGGAKQQIPVNVQAAIDAGDCSKDITLQWGDIVEIPQKNHALDAPKEWLSDPNRATFQYCLRRAVRIVIAGRTNEITLTPATPRETVFDPNKLHSYDLRNVILSSHLLLSSSDTSRVRVARDGHTREYSLDGNGFYPWQYFNNVTQGNELWFILHDGDTIEIPEK